ncbi:MAG: hypothetical protein WCT41_02825 [Candidatus Paceibacterota bacterium]|jgi:hypothetical protein
MSAKSLVAGVHPVNENELRFEEHPDGTVTIPLTFRDRTAAEDFIQAVNDQNTPSSVHWQRVYDLVETQGGLLDPSQME